MDPDQATVISKLIEAQKKQGDLEELKATGEVSMYETMDPATMRVHLKHKQKIIQDLKDQIKDVKKQQEPLHDKLAESIRFSMSLRNEI